MKKVFFRFDVSRETIKRAQKYLFLKETLLHYGYYGIFVVSKESSLVLYSLQYDDCTIKHLGKEDVIDAHSFMPQDCLGQILVIDDTCDEDYESFQKNAKNIIRVNPDVVIDEELFLTFLDRLPFSSLECGRFVGVSRFLCHVFHKRDKKDRLVLHRRVHLNDERMLLIWRNDSRLSHLFFNQEKISLEEHQAWFRQKQADGQIFEIIEADGNACGVLRLDYDHHKKGWLLGWYLIPEYQGSGIGSIVLFYAKRMVPCIIAEVLSHNNRAQAIMEKEGFVKKSIQENIITYIYQKPPF